MKYPDAKKHLIVSNVKSAIRIGGYAFLPFNLSSCLISGFEIFSKAFDSWMFTASQNLSQLSGSSPDNPSTHTQLKIASTAFLLQSAAMHKRNNEIGLNGCFSGKHNGNSNWIDVLRTVPPDPSCPNDLKVLQRAGVSCWWINLRGIHPTCSFAGMQMARGNQNTSQLFSFINSYSRACQDHMMYLGHYKQVQIKILRSLILSAFVGHIPNS